MMRERRLDVTGRRLAGAMMLLVVTAACGSGGSGYGGGQGTAKTATKPVDACKIMTKADVEAAFPGQPVSDARGGADDCTYEVGSDPLTTDVALNVDDSPEAKSAHFGSAQLTKDKFGEQPVPVPGIGDDAYYQTKAVDVLKGSIAFTLQVLPPHVNDDQRDVAVGLAKVVAARLP
jgi:hypothetical protein